MSLIKNMILGAAVAYGLYHITKKGEDGKSILGDFTDGAPDWLGKIKDYVAENVDRVTEAVKQHSPAASETIPFEPVD